MVSPVRAFAFLRGSSSALLRLQAIVVRQAVGASGRLMQFMDGHNRLLGAPVDAIVADHG
jgi:hypothetical protein